MEYELTVEARTENNDAVLSFLDPLLEKNGFSKKAQIELNIAVEELFVNIARYAYNPEVGLTEVRVEVEPEPPQVSITFIDHGVPYDPLAKDDPDLTLSAEERQIGGLGVFLVKKTMDDVNYEYKDGQNILTLKKNL